ncbi:MAG: BatA domain-containing protein [Bacteroidia bacterium]|nr:BatA domain-containing protein [Bacteroidia bacterium]NND24528.1 hypothetical protein [Flavobacteriaceae bacterium]
MQFKNPEILYALLLLIIPIIVHLFQLRRFQKVPFTNVEFLKNVTIQTRKSQQLKKWLTLLTRLLILSAIILAFAQPFTSQNKSLNSKNETVIYLDNSFSMQAKGEKGELMKRALQDLLSSVNENEELTIFTNDQVFRNVTIKSVRNELLQLPYTNSQLDYESVLLKGKNYFRNSGDVVRNLVVISDFQQGSALPKQTDSLVNTFWTQLRSVNTNNISIDSVYVSGASASSMNLNVVINYQESSLENVPISMFDNEELISKTAVAEGSNQAVFSLPNKGEINGKVTVEDAMLQFDNSFYFNINERKKINVLSINSNNADFLFRIFTDDEFDFKSVAFNQLNYNDINDQNLIILNEIEAFPQALINALNAFLENDGYVLIIPSDNIVLNSYNQFITLNSNTAFVSKKEQEKKVTNINYEHPLFADVFDKKVSNFQYPKVNHFYEINSRSGSILSFEDNHPFLIQNANIFLFTAPLNLENSNVINSPLIVPTLYNIANQSFKLPKLYYTVGKENTFNVNTSLQQDDILKLKSATSEVIPQQRSLTNKVVVTTLESPSEAGIYSVNSNGTVIERVSYNYARSESNLIYYDLANYPYLRSVDSIPQVMSEIKSATNINALWKWFVIFALIFLIIEMLILKYIR